MWMNRESWLVLSILTLGASFFLQATVLGGWMLLGHIWGREPRMNLRTAVVTSWSHIPRLFLEKHEDDDMDAP